MTTIYTAIAAAAFALCALTARADTVTYGPALECKEPVNGVSECRVVATGRVVKCSIVDGIKICF